MKKLAILLTTILLTGCGNMMYVMDTYGDEKMVRGDLEFEGHEYRIFHRKDLNKVMITPSIGDAARGGFVKGATLGAVNIQNDKERYSSVASTFLRKDKPTENCELKTGEIILDPQWEFVYLCKQI